MRSKKLYYMGIWPDSVEIPYGEATKRFFFFGLMLQWWSFFSGPPHISTYSLPLVNFQSMLRQFKEMWHLFPLQGTFANSRAPFSCIRMQAHHCMS